MYYPTTPEEPTRRAITPWLPKFFYGVGLGDFIRANPALTYLLIAPYLSLFYKHTYMDAKVLQLYGGNTLNDVKQPIKFPVVIFSHGYDVLFRCDE